MKYTYDPDRQKEFNPRKIYPATKIEGIDIENLLESDSMFVDIEQTIENAVIETAKKTDEIIIKSCMAVHVDPDALIKQANLIAKLRNALDVLGQNYVGCNFTELFELRKENEWLREQLYGFDDRGDYY